MSEWHENGQKVADVEYKDGELHGTVRHWYETGGKRMQGTRQDGQPYGVARCWSADGKRSSASDKCTILGGK